MSSSASKTPRIAIVHDWLTGMRGGEKVLEQFCRLMPRADIFTLVHARGSCSRTIESRRIVTSVLGRLPGVKRYYRHLLPLMPWAIGRLDVSGYDVILSSSHCVAKGIGGRRAGQLHVCYCYTPMRYLWGAADDYQRRLGLTGLALKAIAPALRKWDRRTAQGVDHFIAISEYIARRISAAYGRGSVVLYPPVDADFYTPADSPREDYYLIVSALAPYKRVDQAIEAFRALGRPLKIIGVGQEYDKLRRSLPSNVEMLGWRGDEEIREHYRRCRALIFTPREDFGIVPLEAMACGAPVIAYGEGGATETVLDAANPAVERPTGLLYRPQTVEALSQAVTLFEGVQGRFDSAHLRTWAEAFSCRQFQEGFKRILTPLLHGQGFSSPWE